jgi:hypothetical protein
MVKTMLKLAVLFPHVMALSLLPLYIWAFTHGVNGFFTTPSPPPATKVYDPIVLNVYSNLTFLCIIAGMLFTFFLLVIQSIFLLLYRTIHKPRYCLILLGSYVYYYILLFGFCFSFFIWFID